VTRLQALVANARQALLSQGALPPAEADHPAAQPRRFFNGTKEIREA